MRIAYEHRPQCGEGQGEERAGSGWRRAKVGEEMGDTCHSVNNKDKKIKMGDFD